ncbi:MAG TPA: tRNA pseudouridine(38-40) synthase TruA, partial [Burkholderiales bacterium]|nr:tRNA pseudouridine(38-40) synthase TruA [Burkholderiales bacterium]
YDGSTFHGWQSQPFGCTLQDSVEAAVSSIAGRKTEVSAAGRTDRGVHALSQVAHFDVDVERPLQAWVRGVNSNLPQGIAVLWAKPVNEEFHARFSAIYRRYRYLLLNHPVRPGLMSGKTGWCHQELDVDRMREGAAHLIGEHDFSAFRAAECQANSPVREMQEISIERSERLFVFDIRANAFLHHMVRNIVGSLVYVGRGNFEPGWMGELLASRNRTLAAPTFSPCGLYLAEVGYDPKWGIPPVSDRVRL